jgi:hypothetical protein
MIIHTYTQRHFRHDVPYQIYFLGTQQAMSADNTSITNAVVDTPSVAHNQTKKKPLFRHWDARDGKDGLLWINATKQEFHAKYPGYGGPEVVNRRCVPNPGEAYPAYRARMTQEDADILRWKDKTSQGMDINGEPLSSTVGLHIWPAGMDFKTIRLLYPGFTGDYFVMKSAWDTLLDEEKGWTADVCTAGYHDACQSLANRKAQYYCSVFDEKKVMEQIGSWLEFQEEVMAAYKNKKAAEFMKPFLRPAAKYSGHKTSRTM